MKALIKAFQFCTVSAGWEWNHCKAILSSENRKSLALIWSWVVPSMLKVWHSWMNAWRWRFESSLPVKGECCTMWIVEVLISNGLPISVRFKIGRSMMSGVHSSPILCSCGWSPIGGSRFSRALWGGKFFGDSDDPSSSDYESTKYSFLGCCASRLLSL
jgi:hypothetical protein